MKHNLSFLQNEFLRKLFQKNVFIRIGGYFLLFVFAFFFGEFIARSVPDFFQSLSSSDTDTSSTAVPVSILCSAEGNWGLSFQEEGKPPVANASAEDLKKYNAYYANITEDNVLYLTFDAGFENGNTPAILEALKKHNAPATFFVVGPYISNNRDLINRMLKEGHTVGNHTYHHPDMSQIADKDSFQKELQDVENIYKEITGQEMKKYYRPPQGKYSEQNLSLAKELGYHTFFWSLAYVDWYENDQPTREEAFEKLIGRIHPGAIVLLHSTSSTNAEILDELLTQWEQMGYTFHSLDELVNS